MPFYNVDNRRVHLKFARGKAPDQCVECGGIAGFACDCVIVPSVTCDAPLCEQHAIERGEDIHYCPRHASGVNDAGL